MTSWTTTPTRIGGLSISLTRHNFVVVVLSFRFNQWLSRNNGEAVKHGERDHSLSLPHPRAKLIIAAKLLRYQASPYIFPPTKSLDKPTIHNSTPQKMTQQYAESRIDIIVFSNLEQTEEITKASVDASLPISLISRGLVNRLRVRYEEYRHGPFEDQQNHIHNPLGEVELHLHRSDVAKSQPENFLVVDSIDTVVLRATAVPRKKESNVLTLGLEPQNEGTRIPSSCSSHAIAQLLYNVSVTDFVSGLDQKRRQELKKQDVQSRRAREKRDQEDREKQKRGQQSPVPIHNC